MKVQVKYKRHDPDTLLGEKLEVTYIYSSFDGREVDAMEEQVRKTIGDGLIGEITPDDMHLQMAKEDRPISREELGIKSKDEGDGLQTLPEGFKLF